MALKKQTIDLPIIGGINQKISDKNLRPPNLKSLINGRYREQGKIDKRYGYTNLKLDTNSGTTGTPVAINSLRDELVMFTSGNVYSYSSSDSKWYSRGEIATATTKVTDLLTPTETNYTALDMVAQDGIIAVTYSNGSNLYYALYDEATLTKIKNETLIVASNTFARIATISGQIAIVYNDNTNDIDYILIPTANPTNITTGTLYSNMNGSRFEMIGQGNNFFLFYQTTTTDVAIISKLDNSMTEVVTNNLGAEATSGPQMAMKAFYSKTEMKTVIALLWHDTTDSEVQIAMFDTGTNAILAVTTVEALAATGNLILAEDSTTGNSIGAYYSIDGAVDSKDYIKYTSVTTGGTVGTPAVFLRSVSLASTSCSYEDRSYFNVLHSSTLQPTYFTVDTSAKVVAKFVPGEGPATSDIQKPSNLAVSSVSTDFFFPILKKGRILSENATLFSPLGLSLGELSFETKTRSITTQLNNSLLISGGVLRAYDGESATEYGFHLYPEDVSIQETGSGSVPNGTYLVYAVYEWYNSKGVRQQSAPSVAKSVTVSGAGSTLIEVTVPTLRLTDKTSDIASLYSRDDVTIKTYITEAGGTVPYYSGFKATNTDILANDTVTININSDLSTITANEILYTSGGALDNVSAEFANYTFIYDNRLITVGGSDGNLVKFSKSITSREAVGFNEDLELRVDPLGGDLVAGASIEGYMVLFKETAIYTVYGSGPNDLGINSQFSAPELISADIGCKAPKSILQTPEGVIFQSEKGIYILTKGLELSYIGANVEDYNDCTIVSANILKDVNEIRFVTEDNVTLVYNYYFKAWAVDSTFNAKDATVWQNTKYTYISTTKALQEDPTTYLDDGSYVSTTIRTGWINLAGLQGYQRLYEIGLLGEYKNNHTFQIKSYYNYSDIAKETVTITASDLVNTAVYGDSATYGADDYYGGSENDEVYQTRYRPTIQKCESMSIELVDSIVGSNNGQGFSLEGLSITVGRKNGLFKTSRTRSN